MDILVTVTRENTRVFPMHNHAVWEVMLYTAGTGALKTDAGDFSFHADTVIAVPPRLRHADQIARLGEDRNGVEQRCARFRLARAGIDDEQQLLFHSIHPFCERKKV